MIEGIVPAVGPIGVERLRPAAQYRRMPFEENTMAACSAFSKAIFDDESAKKYPELLALAFWLRRTNLEKLRQQFEVLKTETGLRVARGVAFHIAPANVDTIFVYSLVISMLMGNANIVRVSQKRNPQTEILCRLLNDVLRAEEFSSLAQATWVVTYPHAQETTAALTGLSDVRVIWGGDDTVDTIRKVSIPPHGHEFVFPDRTSIAVLNAELYVKASEEARGSLADAFYNDSYWFDQAACSSPRAVIWVGERSVSADAQALFYPALQSAIQRRRYKVTPSIAMNKVVALSAAAIELPLTRVVQNTNEVIAAIVDGPPEFPENHCGGGFFLDYQIPRLNEIIPALTYKVQTMTYFGFDQRALNDFAIAVNGRGIDRIVPFGDALNFSRYWDGKDLFAEFTKRVDIRE